MAMVRLPGHVLPALSAATAISAPSGRSHLARQDAQPIALTIVLRRDKQSAFDRYLKDLRDPHSKNFRHYLTQHQIADEFGPSRDDYDSVLAYLRANGFRLVEGSENRLTLTVAGTRGDAERAFDVNIGDYRIGKQIFFANQADPALPRTIASSVLAISGLSSYAAPKPGREALFLAVCSVVAAIQAIDTINDPTTYQMCFLKDRAICFNTQAAAAGYSRRLPVPNVCNPNPTPTPAPVTNVYTSPRSKPEAGSLADVSASPWQSVDGTGQTVGLVEFDNFNLSDVSDFLNLIGAPESQINNISEVNVGGGASIGSGEDEVLLDIDAVTAVAPGAKVVVYDAPFAGAGSSFQAVFNKMINDGVSIISNSWAYCEDQTTAADVDSIDTIFQNAAASNITIFNGSGDGGSTCLDGSPNTVSVPADSPNATAVGGSSLTPGPGFTYGTETWWNDSNTTPPAGQGGFGTSKFFAAPSYQSVLTGSTMRMVPDVVANADPFHGVQICQADDGGCPNGKEYGGTSLAAPEWAAYTALLNQGVGQNVGFFNPALYSLSATAAFHNAASLGSDFTHVGLGSPDLSALYSALTMQSPAAVSASASTVAPYLQNGVQPAGAIGPVGEPDDGTTASLTLVSLYDSNGIPVAGKTVTLTAPGSNAQISPTSGVSDADGNVSFQVTDSTPETATLIATDTTDGMPLSAQPSLAFVTAPAAAAGLAVFPNSVTADGATPADITVTLTDSKGRPSPGKLIQINQTGGNSAIGGPNPPVTDSNGMIEFTAVDSNNETITYSAVDVTDGNLPFPETGTVTFSNAPEAGCSNTFVAAPGFVAQPYATGFLAQNFSVGGLQISGCPGAFGLAFDSSGNLFVVDQPTGDIYKFPPGGGVANSHTLLTQTALPSLDELAIDSDGNLYGGLNETGGNSTDGAVVQIDPSTGIVLRTVASGLTCPGLIAIDPLSGDIFAADNCSGDGLNSSLLWRVSNPSGTTSVYATLPNNPNGTEAFAPDGTLYVLTASQIARVSGTDESQPATVSVVPNLSTYGLGLLAQGTQSNGDAQFLIASFNALGNVPGGIGTFDLTSSPPAMSSTLVTDNGQAVDITIGPDGCVYAARGVAVFKITDTTGACTYAAANPAASLSLTPIGITPNPAQGSSQSFTASFHYSTAPDGTPVLLNVSGANPQAIQGNTAGGSASFSYTPAHQGVDTIVASAALASTILTSNQAVLTVAPGADVTFLSLNSSPTSGTQSQSVNLVASLTDVSATPPVAINGQSISFSLGGSTCGGTTNASGIASCSANAGSAGIKTLSASFAGTTQYVASNAATGFNVIAPAATPTRTATPTATPTPVAGKLRVSPKTLNFGVVDVGSSKVKEVKITNLGKITKKKHPVPILIESESGAASPFSITEACDDDDLGPRSKGVKPGTCEVSVTFTPSTETRYEGSLMIKDNLEPGFGQ
ncbi:MAG: protease pro-enzyme activation domain-containing protein, partial [Candidatus Binataceae bacterium]